MLQAFGIDGYSPLGQLLTLLIMIVFVAVCIGIVIAVVKGYKSLVEKHPEETKTLQSVVKATDKALDGVVLVAEQLTQEIKEATKGETFLASPVTCRLLSELSLPEVYARAAQAARTPPLRWKLIQGDQDAGTLDFEWQYTSSDFPPQFQGSITSSLLLLIQPTEQGTLVHVKFAKLGPGEMLYSKIEEQAIQLTKNVLQGVIRAQYV